MKINPIKIANLYEANISKNATPNNANIKKDIQHNNDKVEISSTGLNRSEVESVKARLVYEISKGTSEDRIQRLKVEIKNGTYNVSSADIAEAILNGKITK